MISLPHVVGGQREAAFLRVRDALYEAKAQALVISHEVVDIVHGDIALPGKSAVPTFPVTRLAERSKSKCFCHFGRCR
jgi:hypothetical protein